MAELEVYNAQRHALDVFQHQMGVLKPYFDDPSVTEIMVNAPDSVWIEARGVMSRTDLVIPPKQVESAVKALASANRQDIKAVLDCRMPGFRIAAALEPVALRGVGLCIRKHSQSNRRLDDYLEAGGLARAAAHHRESAPPPTADEVARGGDALARMIRWIVRARKNVVIAGATGSGKTTFMNAFLAEVPGDERILTIEDTSELRVAAPNYVSFEAITEAGVSVRSLVRLALRFRPDRIFVGEVRGPEAYDLLDAMNTGHSGGACSLHANSPELALARLENLVRMNGDAANYPLNALRQQISQTIDYVIFCSRIGDRRGPEQLLEVQGIADDGTYRTRSLFDARNH